MFRLKKLKKKGLIFLLVLNLVFNRFYKNNSNQMESPKETKIETVITELRAGENEVNFHYEFQKFPTLISQADKLSPAETEDVNLLMENLKFGNLNNFSRVVDCRRIFIVTGQNGGHVLFRYNQSTNTFEILAQCGESNKMQVIQFLKEFDYY